MPDFSPLPDTRRRTVAVGPLRITIDLHPRFEDAVDLLLAGFVGASDVPARCDVHLTLDLGQLDRHEPQAAHFVREGSVLVGRCEAWHARLGASSDRVSAHFGIRDSRHLSLAPQ